MVNNEKALSKIRVMFSVEGIAFTDKTAALKSINETVLPTKLTKIYLQELERINEHIIG